MKTRKNTKAAGSPGISIPKGIVVYVGPNLSDPLLAKMTVLSGISAPVKQAIERQPELGKLFVPVSQLATARQQTQLPGHPLAEAYQTVSAGHRAANP